MSFYLVIAIITGVIGSILTISGFSGLISYFLEEGRMGGSAIALFFGIAILMICWSNIRKFMEEKKSQKFLSKCDPETVNLIDEVLSQKDPDKFINNKYFAKNDVRFGVMTYKKEWLMVLSGECVYEKHAESYQGPAQGIRNIRFAVGQEYRPQQREMVDVQKFAEAGMMAGGLGVAAMNAADAIKANAEGGMIVSGGKLYPVTMKSSGDSTSIKIVIIRNDIIEKFDEPYMYANGFKGKYYTAYYIIPDNAATAQKCGKELTKYIRSISNI